jgi:hypothetical protein
MTKVGPINCLISRAHIGVLDVEIDIHGARSACMTRLRLGEAAKHMSVVC